MNSARWRTPGMVLSCGSIIRMRSFGTRQSFGLFWQPFSFDGRELAALPVKRPV